MKRRAKFYTASFILGGEIRNRTNSQKTNKQTNHKQYGKQYIYTLPNGMCGQLPTNISQQTTICILALLFETHCIILTINTKRYYTINFIYLSKKVQM